MPWWIICSTWPASRQARYSSIASGSPWRKLSVALSMTWTEYWDNVPWWLPWAMIYLCCIWMGCCWAGYSVICWKMRWNIPLPIRPLRLGQRSCRIRWKCGWRMRARACPRARKRPFSTSLNVVKRKGRCPEWGWGWRFAGPLCRPMGERSGAKTGAHEAPALSWPFPGGRPPKWGRKWKPRGKENPSHEYVRP